MRRAIVASLFILFSPFLFSEGATRILFVLPGGSVSYAHIQAAIDSSAAGDTIVVMAGTYTGDGNHDIDFRGKAIRVMSQRSYDPDFGDSTVIDGENLYRGFYFHSQEDTLSVLEGFVIQGCNVSDDFYNYFAGAGILCLNSSPTILNNSIRACRAGNGAGIMSVLSSPRIRGNTISLCYSFGAGTGIYCDGGSPVIEGNSIGGNECAYCEGTALTCQGCTTVRIVGNDISGNMGGSDYAAGEFESLRQTEALLPMKPGYIAGGGIVVQASDVLIRDNRFGGNHGEIIAYASTLSILDNEITGGYTSPAVYCFGAAVISGNRISSPGCQHGGSLVFGASGPSRVVDNIIGPGDSDFEGEIGGVWVGGDTSTIVANNVIFGHMGSGLRCRGPIRIEGNLIYSNTGSNEGGGIYCEGSPLIQGNTIVGNSASLGSGIRCTPGSSPLIRANIVAFNRIGYSEQGGEGISADSLTATIECCDVFGNEGGNYAGIPDQTGMNGNISADPIFCDALHGDYTIHERSPCAPGNHPEGALCELIGAKGIGCDYAATLVKSYRVSVRESAILVTWELSEAAGERRFAIFRSLAPGGEYREIEGASVEGTGTTFSFTDDRCEPGSAYRYRVEAVEGARRVQLFETDVITAPVLPLALRQNHPNPFNPSTEIGYYLPKKERIRLEIYDVSGRRVVTLVDEVQERGERSVPWYGNDGLGAPVASGVYFGRLTAGKESVSRKLILLR